MTGRTVLLLGGTGFVGTNLAAHLRRNGERVLVSGRNAVTRDGYPALSLPLGETQALLDLIATERVDTVVHLASSLIPSSLPDLYFAEVKEIAIPTVRLARGLADAGVRLIYLSSGGTVYGPKSDVGIDEDSPCEPISTYGQSKYEIELHLKFLERTRGLRCLIIRPSNPYGPFQSLFGIQGLISVVFGKLADNSPLEVWGDGSSVRDYIYIEDVVEILGALIARDISGLTLNLGSGTGISLVNVIKTFQTVVGRHPVLVHKPARSVDVPRLVLDVGRMHALGLQQARSLAEGIRAYGRWLGVLDD